MPRLLTYPRAEDRRPAPPESPEPARHEDGEQVVSMFALLEGAWRADERRGARGEQETDPAA